MLHQGQIIGRYEVMTKLGEGASSQVFRVRHLELGSEHAMKVLGRRSQVLCQRLTFEGRVQATLQHPNVVHVSDILDLDGIPALVMDLVHGPDLAAWIDRERPDPAAAEAMFRGIVAGVRAAHRAGWVHRDLKPANILVDMDIHGRPVPRITDFGVVKCLEDEVVPWQTMEGVPVGTPGYMAPEQIRNAAGVGPEADVFSLGCIFYEMLAHRSAFAGDNVLELFDRVLAGDHEALMVSNPDVPLRLAEVVEGCLDIDATRRFQSCDEVLHALDHASPRMLAPPRRGLSLGVAAAVALVAASFVLTPVGAVAVALVTGAAEAPAHAAIADVRPAPLVEAVMVEAAPVTEAEEDGVDTEKEEAPGVRLCGEIKGRGWAKAEALFGPSEGEWTATSMMAVYADRPSEDNGWQTPERPICLLRAGTTVQVKRVERAKQHGRWLELGL